MPNRFTDRRLGVDTKHMGRGWGWGNTRLLRPRPPGHHRSWWRHDTLPCSLLRFHFQIYSDMLMSSVRLSPHPRKVKCRLVFPSGIWARWGHLLGSLEPVRRGCEQHLPPSAHRHATQNDHSLRSNPSTGLLLATLCRKNISASCSHIPPTNFLLDWNTLEHEICIC